MIYTSLIPGQYYSPIFYSILLFLVVIKVITIQGRGLNFNYSNNKEYYTFILFFIVTLFIGLRPISNSFGDMWMYEFIFDKLDKGKINEVIGGDLFWNNFTMICTKIMNSEMFFLLCTTLYILPMFLASKKLAKKHKYILFLMLIASFSFWGYAVNGIRNGVATSLFLFALTFNNKKHIQYILMVLSYFIHGSLLLPVLAFVLSRFFTNSRHYLFFWIMSIPLSLNLGGLLDGFFESLGFGGERLRYLSDRTRDDQFTYTGFRWDFLLYSASAVYLGYYYIFIKGFRDKFYTQTYNIYLFCNAMWILIIRASFSNRFAYLSWFLIALIIFYPLLKERFLKNQTPMLSYTILGYFAFTFFMFAIGK